MWQVCVDCGWKTKHKSHLNRHRKLKHGGMVLPHTSTGRYSDEVTEAIKAIEARQLRHVIPDLHDTQYNPNVQGVGFHVPPEIHDAQYDPNVQYNPNVHQITQQMTQQTTQHMTQQMTQQMTQHMTKQMAQQMTQQMPQQMTKEGGLLGLMEYGAINHALMK